MTLGGNQSPSSALWFKCSQTLTPHSGPPTANTGCWASLHSSQDQSTEICSSWSVQWPHRVFSCWPLWGSMKSDFKCKRCKCSEQEGYREYLEHRLLPWNCVEREGVLVVMDLIMGLYHFMVQFWCICDDASVVGCVLVIPAVSSGCKFCLQPEAFLCWYHLMYLLSAPGCKTVHLWTFLRWPDWPHDLLLLQGAHHTSCACALFLLGGHLGWDPACSLPRTLCHALGVPLHPQAALSGV